MYILIQPMSHTDKDKNVYDYNEIIRNNPDKRVILIGSIQEREAGNKYSYPNVTNLCGKLTIFQTAYLIENAEIFYCNEGGLAHIANAKGTNTIVFYNSKIMQRAEYRVMHKSKHMNYVEVC